MNGYHLKDFMDSSYILKELEKSVEKKKMAFRKNLPSFIWTVIENLFVIAIIIGVFNFASSSFETAIFSLLIIIYLGVKYLFNGIEYTAMLTDLALSNELYQIKLLLKYQEGDEEREKREKAMEAFNKFETKFLISSMFLFLFFLIAVWKLLSVII